MSANETSTLLAPPVMGHSVNVRGYLPRDLPTETETTFALTYHNTSVAAAVEAAKQDARRIFGTDKDATVVVEHVYVSN